MSVPSDILRTMACTSTHPGSLSTPEHAHTRLQEGHYEASVAAVRDRVVQQAIKIVIEPIVEADFLPCSFGFRPKRSAHHALQAMREAVREGRTWVVDADIESFF